jgi:P-type conjugative transfer protein TrbJ
MRPLRFLTAVALSVAVLVSAQPAAAQLTVFDPANYAQAQIIHAEQINQTLKQIAQIQHELQQIQQMAQQLAYMKQSIQQLPQEVWNRARNDLAELDQLVAKEGDLMGQSAQYDQIFARLYPGYSPQSGLNQTYLQLDKNTQTAAHALQSMVDASISQVQSGTFKTQSSDNKTMIGMANASQSQVSALTAGNTLAAQSLEQLQKLQTLDALRSQVEMNYYLESLAAQKLQTKHLQQDERNAAAMANWLRASCPTGQRCPGVPQASPSPKP